MLPARNNSALCSEQQSRQSAPSGVEQDLVPDYACLSFLSRLSHKENTPTSFADALHSPHLIVLNIETLLGPTGFAPVDIDHLSVGAIKTYWIPGLCSTLDFGSNPAIVAISGVEKYVLGVHHAVKKFCEQSSNRVLAVRYEKADSGADN